MGHRNQISAHNNLRRGDLVTGGVSRRLPIPRSIYAALFRLDTILSRASPELLAASSSLRLPEIISAAVNLGHRIGNVLYKAAFPIYRPLYSAFKVYADRSERRFLARYLFAGAVVVDAGANIGIYTQFLSRCVRPGGAVHSFEPSPENFARLREAVAGLSNVCANQLAVTDQTGESVLYLSDELNVDHRAYPTAGETRRTLSIRSTKLDDYFKPGERVDLIKMDVQGYEVHALRGAERVIHENRGIKLLLEFWPYGLGQARVHWKDVLLTLERHGMSIQQFSRNSLTPLRSELIQERPGWYVNLLAYRS